VKRFVLDTNLYVSAFRSRDEAAALERFYSAFAPAVHLSAIVLYELLVGAATAQKRAHIEDLLARPLRRTGRIVCPSTTAWEAAGRALAELVRMERRDVRSVPKSFANDVLLAASCREAGLVLVTDNVSDFERIRRVLRFRFEAPWPK
jgi:predicted nucleic acid-binding protein